MRIKRWMTGALMVLMAGPVAAWETTQQKLERAVQEDQLVLERGRFDGKPITWDARRKEAQVKLAKDQAELEAFKTAGPAAYEQARLEKAIKDDQEMIDTAWRAGKLAYRDAQVKAGKEKLAKDQAALEAFKTAGPVGFERVRLNEAIEYDQWVIATGGGENKMVQRDARIKAARTSLAEHEAALAALK